MAENGKHYAWSTILCGTSEKPVTINIGDAVTASSVGGKETFDELVEAGSIRNKPYPTNIKADEAPSVARLREIREELEASGQTLEEMG